MQKLKQKNIRRKERDLQKRLSDLDQIISSASSADNHLANHLEAEYNQLKQELCLIYENRGKGSIIRSKKRWIEQVEDPTKYFFNLEKRNYNHKTIKELKYPEGKSVTKEEEILEEIERFYKELYTSTTSLKMRNS